MVGTLALFQLYDATGFISYIATSLGLGLSVYLMDGTLKMRMKRPTFVLIFAPGMRGASAIGRRKGCQ